MILPKRYYQSKALKDWRYTSMLYINAHQNKISYRVNTRRISEAQNQARDLSIEHYDITNSPTYTVETLEDF
jgi:hypothetical protein